MSPRAGILRAARLLRMSAVLYREDSVTQDKAALQFEDLAELDDASVLEAYERLKAKYPNWFKEVEPVEPAPKGGLS